MFVSNRANSFSRCGRGWPHSRYLRRDDSVGFGWNSQPGCSRRQLAAELCATAKFHCGLALVETLLLNGFVPGSNLSAAPESSAPPAIARASRSPWFWIPTLLFRSRPAQRAGGVRIRRPLQKSRDCRTPPPPFTRAGSICPGSSNRCGARSWICSARGAGGSGGCNSSSPPGWRAWR